jgi:spermidine/putrescine transport system substrate-binding protein
MQGTQMIKKINFLFFCLLLAFCLSLHAEEEKLLNLYTWGNYFPPSILKSFTKKTGIVVHYSVYDSNETLYTKLKSNPNVGYDLILPSSYYIEKMAKEHLLKKLSVKHLPFTQSLLPAFRHPAFDPSHTYSVPLFWGGTGIVVNTKYINFSTVTSWKNLWEPRFHHRLLLLNDMREIFSIALIRLHYSPNTENPLEIKAAYRLLKKLMPNVRLFNSDNTTMIYNDDDIHIGIGWNGDIFRASHINPHLRFIYPHEGYMMWIDCFAIPYYAPHPNNAYEFMHFILKKQNLRKIIIRIPNSSTSQQVISKLPSDFRDSPIFNPDQHTLKKALLQRSLSAKAQKLYAHYWQLLKLS